MRGICPMSCRIVSIYAVVVVVVMGEVGAHQDVACHVSPDEIGERKIILCRLGVGDFGNVAYDEFQLEMDKCQNQR